MFFIMGINNGQKKLNFSQYMTCTCCGRSVNVELFVTYTYFMFFFIPLFKWNRRYFAVARCCNASAQLDPETGKAIERGEKDHLDPSEVNFVRGGAFNAGGYYEEGGIRERAAMNGSKTSDENGYIDKDGLHRVRIRTCKSCGYETGEDFQFCPKCGKSMTSLN